MQEVFKRYPDVEILADALDPFYRVKYTECVEERGVLRFLRHEAKVPKDKIESLVLGIVKISGEHR